MGACVCVCVCALSSVTKGACVSEQRRICTHFDPGQTATEASINDRLQSVGRSLLGLLSQTSFPVQVLVL